MAMSWDDITEAVEETTRDARRLQLVTLRRILEAGRGADYLLRHGITGDCDDIDADEFRSKMPVSSYEDYRGIIDRIADGVAPASEMSSLPLLCFFLSSGTSGSKPKLLPFFDSSHARAISVMANGSAFARKLFPPRRPADKILWFLYAGHAIETKSGLKAMAASAYGIQASLRSASSLFSICVSPPSVIVGTDAWQQMYCHLLSGLVMREQVVALRAPYAAGLVRAIRMLEAEWEQLCNDIESGTLSADVTSSAMWESMSILLAGGQPERAAKIREICRRESWAGALPELWPELRYISCITTGSMQQYYPVLKHYAGAGVALLGGDYMSSECPIGINLDRTLPPEDTKYVLMPDAAFFEFLPFNAGKTSAGKPVDISGVEVGMLYELLVTTYRGLYRYRLGDVVKVVGFHNQSPELQMVTRALKDASELFTEADLSSAMQALQLMLREESTGEVIDYASYTGNSSTPRHVRVFIELRSGCVDLVDQPDQQYSGAPPAFLRRCCLAVEGCLGSVFMLRRAQGEVDLVEVSLVSPGSFDRLADAAVRNGALANQYKTPRIIWDERLADVLRAAVVATASLADC